MAVLRIKPSMLKRQQRMHVSCTRKMRKGVCYVVIVVPVEHVSLGLIILKVCKKITLYAIFCYNYRFYNSTRKSLMCAQEIKISCWIILDEVCLFFSITTRSCFACCNQIIVNSSSIILSISRVGIFLLPTKTLQTLSIKKIKSSNHMILFHMIVPYQGLSRCN